MSEQLRAAERHALGILLIRALPVHSRMYNGLLVAMYALKDVNPGDGGFICVPGCARRRPARLGSQYPTAPL